MDEYTVFFEIYGTHIYASAVAENEEAAKDVIRGQINFHEVKVKGDSFEEAKKILLEGYRSANSIEYLSNLDKLCADIRTETQKLMADKPDDL